MTPSAAPSTPFDSIRDRLNHIDELQGITTQTGATTRRLTREIRQALHVIESGMESD